MAIIAFACRVPKAWNLCLTIRRFGSGKAPHRDGRNTWTNDDAIKSSQCLGAMPAPIRRFSFTADSKERNGGARVYLKDPASRSRLVTSVIIILELMSSALLSRLEFPSQIRL
jgi:hypothetical protein